MEKTKTREPFPTDIYTIQQLDNGKVTLWMYDMPDAEIYAITPINPYKHVVVLKVPGHTYWSSVMDPSRYAPAEYQVYEVIEGNPHIDREFKAIKLIEFPVRKPKGE